MVDRSGKMISDKGEGFFLCIACGINFNSKLGYNIHRGKLHKKLLQALKETT